jgi:hypothetical protein
MSVHTDLDSVWDNKNKAAVAAREKFGISYVFASPENSNKNAKGEKMIQDAERQNFSLVQKVTLVDF